MHMHLIDYGLWCATPVVSTAMRTHMIDYALWFATPMLAAAIAGYMLRGKLHREFPYFFNFVVFQIAAFVLEFPLRTWVNYYYLYWTLSALGILVSFAALIEILQKVVDGNNTARYFDPALLGVYAPALLVCMAIAAMWLLGRGGGNEIDNVTNRIYLVDRTVHVTQFALALLMVLFGTAVGISKRKLVFGITIGFGFAAAVNLAVMGLLSHTLVSKMVLSRLNASAYLISLLIWLAYVATASRTADRQQLPGSPNGFRAIE
jgi:hypothetical protein